MLDPKAALLMVPGVRKVSAARTRLASWYFDRHHHVQTGGAEQLAGLAVTGNNVAHGGHYEGTTPRSGRYMLRQLPVTDFSGYTFMDFGSGSPVAIEERRHEVDTRGTHPSAKRAEGWGTPPSPPILVIPTEA